MEFETERLILRKWKEKDIPLFSALGADSIIMEFMSSCTLSNKNITLQKINIIYNIAVK